MRVWILNLWDALRGSFWFLPLSFLFGSVLLALGIVKLDEVIEVEKRFHWAWLLTTAESSRQILSTLSGALVTFTGVVFSVTMLTLAQTTSQYGSRLLRTILNNNVTQFALGVFVGTSVFCIVVLRNVRTSSVDGSHQQFIPHLATFVAMMCGLASLIVFIYFVNHVSQSIQAQSVVGSVAAEFRDAIIRLYPEKIGESTASSSTPAALPTPDLMDLPVRAQHRGYLQSINGIQLLAIAKKYDAILRTNYFPGEFISEGEPLCSILESKSGPLPDTFFDEVNECFITGNRRTPRQDIECPIYELVEVAMRALSPGINDPHTAMACLDYLGDGLAQLVQRVSPSPYRIDNAGQLRLILKTPSFSRAIDAAYCQIRQYAEGATGVLLRMVESLMTVAGAATDPAIISTLRRHADMIERAGIRSLAELNDRDLLLARIKSLRDVLDAQE